MSTEATPTPAADPNEMREFLTASIPEGMIRFDVPQEVRDEILPEVAKPESESETAQRVEIPRDTTFDPQQPSINNVLFWTMQLPDIGEVKVTDTEKVLYLKAVLNDERVILPITLPIGNKEFTVEIQSRSVFEQNALFQHLEQASGTGEFKDPAAIISRAQQMATALMVHTVNGKEFKSVDLAGVTSTTEAGQRIYAHVVAVVEPMSAVYHNAIMTALRIFEVKMKLCGDNVNNESFWIPAS